jgi:hypothetical protein
MGVWDAFGKLWGLWNLCGRKVRLSTLFQYQQDADYSTVLHDSSWVHFMLDNFGQFCEQMECVLTMSWSPKSRASTRPSAEGRADALADAGFYTKLAKDSQSGLSGWADGVSYGCSH